MICARVVSMPESCNGEASFQTRRDEETEAEHYSNARYEACKINTKMLHLEDAGCFSSQVTHHFVEQDLSQHEGNDRYKEN